MLVFQQQLTSSPGNFIFKSSDDRKPKSKQKIGFQLNLFNVTFAIKLHKTLQELISTPNILIIQY